MKNRITYLIISLGFLVACGGSGEDSLFATTGGAGQSTASGGHGGASSSAGGAAGASSSAGGSSSSVGGSNSSSGGAPGTGGSTGAGGHAGTTGSGGNGQSGGGGSATAGAGGSPSDGGPVDSSGAGGSGQVDSGGGSGPCPVTEPAQGDTCPRVNLACEYGEDPRGDSCRDHAVCTGEGWKISKPNCPALPPTDCPATRVQALGHACDPSGAYCIYEDGLSCACTNCSTGGPAPVCGLNPTWHCEAPNPNPACPAALPNEGTLCAPDALACTYHCGPNGRRVCNLGVWTAANGGPCPVSTRTAKQGIEYLTDEDLQRVASDLHHFRLATYEYKDPALAGRRHLGFIIEDNPDSQAVDREQNMVDLYGYTSMVVAAMQTQSKEIASLKREIAALKRRRP